MKKKTKKWLSMIITLCMVTGLFSHIVTTSAQTETNSIPTDHLIAAGQHHSLAIKEDGTVWTWGYNKYGQLGDGTTTDKNIPQKITVQEGKKAVYAAAGQSCSMVILEDGTLWGWGYNSNFQLCQPLGGNCLTPIQIVIGDGTKKVTSAAIGGRHAAAILEDGSLWTWGNNEYGQLGTGETTNDVYIPTKIIIEEGKKVVKVDAGYNYTAALLEDGSVWAWGSNLRGALGDGTIVEKHAPQKITIEEGKKATDISTGYYHMGAVMEDGSLWTWGYNTNGQLGDGTTKNKSTPQKITVADGKKCIKIIASSQFVTTTILEDGTLWVWGAGYLGNGVNTTSVVLPQNILVEPNKSIESIAVGSLHIMALSESGILWAWGENGWHAVGIEDASTVPSPVSIMQLFTPSIPTTEPTVVPTAIPTIPPTTIPTVIPTESPTSAPTMIPTTIPTVIPTVPPTSAPTTIPTTTPTFTPTAPPTSAPTTAPTLAPVNASYEITDITADHNQVEVDINRLEQRNQDDSVLIALYASNGDLIGIKASSYLSANSDTQSFIFDGITSEFSVIKVFIWDGLNSMAPLCNTANKAV